MEFKVMTFSERERYEKELQIGSLMSTGWTVLGFHTVMNGLSINYSVALQRIPEIVLQEQTIPEKDKYEKFKK